MPSIAQNNAAAKALMDAGKLTPVAENSAPTPPAAPLIPDFPAQPAKYLNSPLPASMWQSPDQQRQFQNGAIPQTRISPLPPNTNPSVGAAAASQAITIVNNESPSTSSDVILTMPAQYSVGTTRSGTEENIDVAWLPVQAGQVLAGPGPIPAWESILPNVSANATAISLEITPGSPTSWLWFVEYSNNNLI